MKSTLNVKVDSIVFNYLCCRVSGGESSGGICTDDSIAHNGCSLRRGKGRGFLERVTDYDDDDADDKERLDVSSCGDKVGREVTGAF